MNKSNADNESNKFDIDQWTCQQSCDRIPQQQNGFDCGIFTCKLAECVSDDELPNFSQRDCAFLRQKISLQLLNGYCDDQ